MTADARSYLVQQLGRFRLAAKGIKVQLEQIDMSIKEVQADLILVIAAVDEIEEDQAKKDAAA
jgi:hypothetical protein